MKRRGLGQGSRDTWRVVGGKLPVRSDAWEGAEGPAKETGCGVLEGAPHLAEGKGAEMEGEEGEMGAFPSALPECASLNTPACRVRRTEVAEGGAGWGQGHTSPAVQRGSFCVFDVGRVGPSRGPLS